MNKFNFASGEGAGGEAGPPVVDFDREAALLPLVVVKQEDVVHAQGHSTGVVEQAVELGWELHALQAVRRCWLRSRLKPILHEPLHLILAGEGENGVGLHCHVHCAAVDADLPNQPHV